MVLLAAAFARPVIETRGGIRRVIVLDGSRAVATLAEVRDSARALYRAGDVLVTFDSTARVVPNLEALASAESPPVRGSLSAALVVALRTGSQVAPHADSLELVIVSPLAAEEWDHATVVVRNLWPGRIQLVSVATAQQRAEGVETPLGDDDPLGAAVSLAGLRRGRGSVRLVRERPTKRDSAWARAAAGALVYWPAAPDPRWPTRSQDMVGAVASGDAVVVAPFHRDGSPPGGRAVAHWVDGAIAAVERPVGAGCQRDVAIRVPTGGDIALSHSMQRLLVALLAPCAGNTSGLPGDSALGDLRGQGRLAAASGFPRGGGHDTRVPANRWLLLVAAVFIAGEPFVRRRKGQQ